MPFKYGHTLEQLLELERLDNALVIARGSFLGQMLSEDPEDTLMEEEAAPYLRKLYRETGLIVCYKMAVRLEIRERRKKAVALPPDQLKKPFTIRVKEPIIHSSVIKMLAEVSLAKAAATAAALNASS